MSRLFHESFDAMTPTQLQQTGKWEHVGSGVVSVTGRTGLGVTGTTGATPLQNTLRTRALNPATASTGYHGLAVKCSSLPVTEQKLLAILDSSNTVLGTVTITPSGTARIYIGTFESGTLVGTTPLVFFSSTFRYVEAGWTLSGAGRFEVRSHPTTTGTPRSFVTNGVTSAAAWSKVEIYLTDAIIIDDPYFNDAAYLSSPNYFTGDTTIEVVRPATDVRTGFGLEEFYPNTGSDKAAVLAETTFDGDVSYDYCRVAYRWLILQMDPLVEDGRRVDDVQIVRVARAVSSDWAPNLGYTTVYWYGVRAGLFFPTPLTTSYRAYLSMMGQPGGNTLTITRVNDSRFGVTS